MTIQQAIKRVDEIKPNAFSAKVKTEWLNALEGRIAANVLLWPPAEIFAILYTWPEDKKTELLAAPPHDDIYIHWLGAQIDAANGEYDKYQNAMQIYNSYYGDFVRWFARTYEPAQGYRKEI